MKKQTSRMALVALSAAMLLPMTTVCGAAAAPEAEGARELAIELGTPFRDHAILQRGMKVPVWGWSKPGTRVSVAFARQKKTAEAGPSTGSGQARWTVWLDPMEANFEPRDMTITESAGKKEVLKDILVGEVWMCSGQSNMQWLAGKCDVGSLILKILARVEAGEEKKPIIREVKVTNKFSSLYPSYRVDGQWSEEWAGFSAIAFAFAYDIAREVQVPVGIVNCAFSTTQIQAWVPREGFAEGTDAYTKAIYRKILESDVSSPEHKAAWTAYEAALKAWAKESAERVKQGLKPDDRPVAPGNLNGNRDATWMCNGKIMPMAPYTIRGAIWNQGFASAGEGIVYRNNLHSLVRGWRSVFRNPDLPVYFHQFYAGKSGNDGLRLSSTAEMRLGTWLAHKEIPNAAMASQIDITGGIHYVSKTVPGQRLARHALKNQYGKKLVANGPMYKDYTVKGNKLIVELDHAKGLQVGKNGAAPVDEAVTLFYLADENLTWHRARMAITGECITLTADGVKTPRGVAYGWNAVGSLPSVYNEAMLPLTPFMLYDHKFVISDQWELDHIKMDGSVPFFTWPTEYIQIAGETIDPRSYGLLLKHRKLWLLSPQFAHNGVIQAGVPTRLYGKALPGSVVSVDFAGFTGSVTMGDEQDEWEMTVPAMEASAEPKLLHVTCTLDGELAHERRITNIVVGDLWYVAAGDFRIPVGAGVPKSGPAPLEAWEGGNAQLRMMTTSTKQNRESMPMRFKLNASGSPTSRFFRRWGPTTGLTQLLAEQIHAKTGKPVGIIAASPGTGTIKEWTGYESLSKVPAWQVDAKELYPRYAPDPELYITNTDAYIKGWREYWQSVKSDPDFEAAAMARFPGAKAVETLATTFYNKSICGFSPGNFKAILCITGKAFVADEEGAAFGEQFSVMANCWKETFAHGEKVIDPHFIYAMPDKALAPKITAPKGIKGSSTAVSTKQWLSIGRKGELSPELEVLVNTAVEAVYE